jgi:pyrroloquinoline quinone biosynthesis protein B
MKVRVLGSAAGGGVPQWNCSCPNCTDARAGLAPVRPRMQSSIAVTTGGKSWVLFNASPDLRFQVESFPAFHPREKLRGSAISAVVLTDAEVDHTAGLLFLREGGEISLFSTAFVREALSRNGLLPTLSAYLTLHWTEIVPGVPLEIAARGGTATALHGGTGTALRGGTGTALHGGASTGLHMEAFEVAGHPPLYHHGNGEPSGGHTIGLKLRESREGAALVYVPGAGAVDAGILDRIGPEDALLWDGTFWTDDELVRLGISQRRAGAMGHLPISGAGGSLELFRDRPVARKVYIHINNTNPILREASPERVAAEAAGWEVAFDGMELEI